MTTTIPVYNLAGAKTGELKLDADLFDSTVRRNLLKEALIQHLASQRQGTHATKNRGMVAGGGKKPWKQKGTGRARQGSTRSPQWVGGGHAHHVGPSDYAYQLPKAQRRKAYLSSLRYRLEKGGLAVVDGFDVLTEPKTKSVAAFLAKVGIAGKGTLLVSEGFKPAIHLSARNIPKVKVEERRNLNAAHLLTNSNVIFTKSAIDALVGELKDELKKASA
ncbi:MAG: 50S ribosomal protein L4 [Planctomycetes bacterium]|nr:50S ribosomal protein L4 [Planctomycetota bacterium]